MSPRSMQTTLVLCLAMMTTLTFAFAPTRHTALSPSLIVYAAAGKGFGEKVPPKKQQSSYNEESNRSIENPIMPLEQNPGQKALAELRRERAEQKNAELENVRKLKSVDEFLKESPDAAVIPEKVAMRMGKRMLPFVGIPLFGGMGAFVAFWYLATYKNIGFQPAMVAFTTIAILIVGLLGITYSVMSTSWDPDREESGLGFDEFQKNLDSLRQGLSRSRENALLRERMANNNNMSKADIQAKDYFGSKRNDDDDDDDDEQNDTQGGVNKN